MTSSQMPSPIAMPCAFANPFLTGESATVTEVNTGASPADNIVSFKKGFGSSYSAPASSNGKYVTRGEMNGVGKALGVDTFRYKCGGLNTFDISFAEAVGGYPKGAVLYGISDTNKLFAAISLQDNNLHNFLGVAGTTVVAGSIDNEWWAYCNTDDYTGNKPVKTVLYSASSLSLACQTTTTGSTTNATHGTLFSFVCSQELRIFESAVFNSITGVTQPNSVIIEARFKRPTDSSWSTYTIASNLPDSSSSTKPTSFPTGTFYQLIYNIFTDCTITIKLETETIVA